MSIVTTLFSTLHSKSDAGLGGAEKLVDNVVIGAFNEKVVELNCLLSDAASSLASRLTAMRRFLGDFDAASTSDALFRA